MKKIVSILMALSLLLSLVSLPVFAADKTSVEGQAPVIKSTVTGHEIDYSALDKVIQSIDDKEKKAELVKLFTTPVTSANRYFNTKEELQKEINSKKAISDETVQLAAALSKMPKDKMDKEISNIIKAKADKILNDKNASTTEQFVQLVAQFDPAISTKLKDKVALNDDQIVINLNENQLQDSVSAVVPMSIISKYYYVYRHFDGLNGDEMTWFSVGVDWQYNNSTWDIVYLAPETDYGVNTDVDNVHFFLGLDQSWEGIVQSGVSDQAYVQKGAYVYASIPGGDWPLHAYIVDLVFRPNIATTSKLVYSHSVCCTPIEYHNYASQWGGGY